jgi:ubiquinone/menaquinone biosynthesis C-methylase UbiE
MSQTHKAASVVAKSEQAYDLAADYYDRWSWQSFWRENEFPVVLGKLLRGGSGQSVLDVGVGTGAFLAYASSSLDPTVPLAGVDVSISMLKHARRKLGSRAMLVKGDIQRGLPFRAASFDAVLLMRVANHLKSLEAAAAEIARVLRHGGALIATDLSDEFKYDCTRIPTNEESVSIETYKHTKSEWRKALHAAGFSELEFSLYGKADLKNKSAGHLGPKLDDSSTAIFCVMRAAKKADQAGEPVGG